MADFVAPPYIYRIDPPQTLAKLTPPTRFLKMSFLVSLFGARIVFLGCKVRFKYKTMFVRPFWDVHPPEKTGYRRSLDVFRAKYDAHLYNWVSTSCTSFKRWSKKHCYVSFYWLVKHGILFSLNWVVVHPPCITWKQTRFGSLLRCILSINQILGHNWILKKL